MSREELKNKIAKMCCWDGDDAIFIQASSVDSVLDKLAGLFTQTYREMLLDEIRIEFPDITKFENNMEEFNRLVGEYWNNEKLLPGWNAYRREMLKIIEEVEK